MEAVHLGQERSFTRPSNRHEDGGSAAEGPGEREDPPAPQTPPRVVVAFIRHGVEKDPGPSRRWTRLAARVEGIKVAGFQIPGCTGITSCRQTVGA